jgi:K+-transporting ATPase ATPase A chain
MGRPCGLDRVLGPLERLLYRVCGVKPDQEMDWRAYALALLVFNLLGACAVYGLQRAQGFLPLNPQDMAAVAPDLALNTAVSFASNTNWQAYGGESTLSYLTQMLALTVQNFASAATGMACLVAVIRGIKRRETTLLGNFWVDMLRSVLYILLPLSLVLAVALVSQGVVQTFNPYQKAALLQPTTYDKPLLDAQGNPLLDDQGKPKTETAPLSEQIIAVGPVASQVAIKQLGTNGGGFFNANSAHPLENPTPLSNFLQMLAILLIPAALCHTLGVMVGDKRQGWVILTAMTAILVLCLSLAAWSEQAGNPLLPPLGVDQMAQGMDGQQPAQPGGNMEGKEARLGITSSAIWATATTAASNGSVNAMHDSFTPLGGLAPLWLIHLGEVVFGGVGSGLYGMLIFVIVSVFIAGLMVGRTPEYLGKKIEAFETKMASLVILIPLFGILVPTALAVISSAKGAVSNPGPHAFSQILYAFSSLAGNNGSAFAGLNVNSPFYNLVGATVMWVCRFWLILPTLALAGSLAGKKTVPASSGTLATHTPLFAGLLVSVVLVVGALTFIPALALGPIVEHLLMLGH